MPLGDASADLVLDPKIRNWVLLPILLVTIFLGILRHYVQLLLKSGKSNTDPTKMRLMSTLQRTASGLSLLPPAEAFVAAGVAPIDTCEKRKQVLQVF